MCRAAVVVVNKARFAVHQRRAEDSYSSDRLCDPVVGKVVFLKAIGASTIKYLVTNRGGGPHHRYSIADKCNKTSDRWSLFDTYDNLQQPPISPEPPPPPGRLEYFAMSSKVKSQLSKTTINVVTPCVTVVANKWTHVWLNRKQTHSPQLMKEIYGGSIN